MRKPDFRFRGLSAQTEVRDGYLAIRVSGRMDFYNCEQLLASFRLVLNQGWSCLDFNFAELEYLDSSGVAVLIEIIKRSRAQKVKVHYHSFPDQMRDLIEILGLTHVLISTQTNPESCSQERLDLSQNRRQQTSSHLSDCVPAHNPV